MRRCSALAKTRVLPVRAIAAQTLWLLGYPAQALARLHEALALAHTLSHPFSLAFARGWAAMVSQFRRDVSAVHEHAEAAVALATAQGFPQWAALGTSFRGWALAMQGQGEAGMAWVRQGIAARRATGAANIVPYLCTVLAEVGDHLGHPADGLQALTRPTPWWSSRRNAGGKRKSPASGASCSCGSRGHRRRRRKPGCSGPWTSPVARRRNRWSCGPP